MSNEFCPTGHELNADGTCTRDGYVKPAELATEPEVTETPETTEVTDAPEELGNGQVGEDTPESPSTGSEETSGLSTDTPPTDENAPVEPTETDVTTDGNAPPENTCVGCEG